MRTTLARDSTMTTSEKICYQSSILVCVAWKISEYHEMKIFSHRADDFCNPIDGRRQIFVENGNFPENSFSYDAMQHKMDRLWDKYLARTLKLVFKCISPHFIVRLVGKLKTTTTKFWTKIAELFTRSRHTKMKCSTNEQAFGTKQILWTFSRFPNRIRWWTEWEMRVKIQTVKNIMKTNRYRNLGGGIFSRLTNEVQTVS